MPTMSSSVSAWLLTVADPDSDCTIDAVAVSSRCTTRRSALLVCCSV